LIHVRVGCSMVYESAYPTPMLLVMCPPQVDTNHRIIEDRRILTPYVSVHEYIDAFGNQIWRIVAPAGMLEIHYDAIAEVMPVPDPVFPYLPKTPVEDLPDHLIVFTLPSRHCPSDLFIQDAWQMFGSIEGGWAQVQAICDWLHANIAYMAGSTSSTTALDAYLQRQGVCRDFAHLGVSFCRALNFPARYVCGYLPDINVPFDPTPMDFHAWFEVYIDGAWRTFDARHNYPRVGRVVIARGRDAVDVAFSTVYGSPRLDTLKVWADEVSTEVRLNPTLPESRE
jgi:transglutaminase-like putative cysteine protease